MIKLFFRYLLMWVILVLIQVLLLNHIQISGFLNPYFYVLFILLLPFETPKYLLLILGFITGFSIDAFSNTPGIHASATTFMAFLRPYVIGVTSTREAPDINTSPTINQMGLAWFFKYTVILVVAHHLFLFFIDAFSLKGFLFTLVRCILSAAFTITLIILSQFLFYKE